ncbi:MAG: Asp-tRNA(Asn)/Glu-tRNA(Gln) amidotransferase subunit GatC [Angelakisella sp.]
MQIDIKHIATLSRLKLEEEQVEKFQRQMQDIVNMVELLPALDGELSVDPNNRMELRPDEIRPSLRREVVLAGAPEVAAGCVAVPQTMES